MPKVVDHQARRRELARALWRVAARDGVQAATVRSVAAEAGRSAGALQHYFATQSDLIGFAMDMVIARARRRVEALDLSGPIRPALQLLLEQVLPLDAERRLEAEVWFALISRAQVDPALAARRHEVDEGMRDAARIAVEGLARAGQLAPCRDPEAEIDRLHALLDGLALHAITRPTEFTPERLSAALSLHLDDLAR